MPQSEITRLHHRQTVLENALSARTQQLRDVEKEFAVLQREYQSYERMLTIADGIAETAIQAKCLANTERLVLKFLLKLSLKRCETLKLNAHVLESVLEQSNLDVEQLHEENVEILSQQQQVDATNEYLRRRLERLPSTSHAETQTENIMELPAALEQNTPGSEALLVPLVLLSKLVNNIPVTKTQFVSGFIGGSISYEICGHVLPLPLKYRPLDRACLKTASTIKNVCTGPKKAKLPSELLASTAVSHEYNAVVGVETHTQAVSVSHFPL